MWELPTKKPGSGEALLDYQLNALTGAINMQIQTEKRYYTRQEYLVLEEAAGRRTTNHNHIIVNLVAQLKFALRGQNYNLFTSDVRCGYHVPTFTPIQMSW